MRKLPVANLFGYALLIVLVALIAGWIVGALASCLQLLMIALVILAGAALLYRWRSARSTSASRQIIDQPTASAVPKDNVDTVARQLEERRRRLDRGE